MFPWPPRFGLAGISQAEIQAEIRSHPGAPTPAPPVRALAPAPYRTQGARRAQATQTAHLTGPQRLQPPPSTPCLPNVSKRVGTCMGTYETTTAAFKNERYRGLSGK